MAKTIDPALAARLREESEQTREAAYPAGARPTRPNRRKVYSIRLSEEEQARVEQVADELLDQVGAGPHLVRGGGLDDQPVGGQLLGGMGQAHPGGVGAAGVEADVDVHDPAADQVGLGRLLHANRDVGLAHG